ncbi:prim-pol domain-containing protein [Meredithblackwellia eburnea MCA 4105]
MLTYYRKLFPYKQLFSWLNQDTTPTKNFTHREFALTLRNDVYIRYNSFTTADELKKEIVSKNPARFEIGPVYSGKPKDRKTLLKSAFKPQLRELVFDIDMTDYDEIRTCCKDKAMCVRCWKFIGMAVKVLDRALRDDFGFQHLLWVYSGRRGIHCWISDVEALKLTDEQRKAVVGYLEVVKGGGMVDKKVNLNRPLHASLGTAYTTLKPEFASTILGDQDCFKDRTQWEKILRMLPDKEQAAQKYEEAVQDIVLQYTYPRIDVEVSKKLNHLLKSPFCVHPGTGRVCVPLLPSQVDSFDPSKVPTVGQLLMELEDLQAKDPAGDFGWKDTSMREYVELFDDFVKGVVRDGKKGRRGVKREMKDQSMEF